MHDAISFSGRLSLATWPDGCFAFGICDYLLGSGFGSSEQYVHFPFGSFHCPDLAQGQEDYSAAEAQWVLSAEDRLGVDFLGVDLILPCLTIVLTNTQVLPTDGANCRDYIWSPSPDFMESWSKEPNTMNFCRV